MHRTPRAAATVCALALASVAAMRHTGGAQERPLALVHATVIDGTGARPRPNTTIVIRGTRIVEVADDAAARIPPGSRVVDLRGRYVIPGLIDSHVHFGTIPRSPEITRAVLAATLMGGVTTVRDMGGALHVVQPLARASADAEAQSPRIYYSAIVAGPGGWFEADRGRRMAGAYAPGESPAVRRVGAGSDVRRVIADARRAGATGIKLYNTVPPPLMAALAAEARRQGLRVWSHLAVDPGRPGDVVRAGAEVVTHADQFAGEVMPEPSADTAVEARRLVRDSVLRAVQPDDARLRELVALMRRRGTMLDATLFIVAGAATDAEGRVNERYARLFAFAAAMVRRAHAAGVPVVAGTDAVGGSTPNLHAELQLLVDRAGLTPLEALRAATLNGARALGAQDSLGTVAAGKLADLVVLAADPARDIRNTQTVVAVIKGGVMRERATPWRQGPHASPPPAAGAQPERR
jgi:imidazolonepropionase-like amidohydrolase